MCRVFLIVCVGAMFGSCHPAEVPAYVPAVSPYTTVYPTGVSPDSETINLRPDVHRAFILEKREYILGEPIVVEMRTWPRDESAVLQHTGGSSRLFGRNNNFVFLLQHESGEWVAGPQSGSDRGGLISGIEATTDEPIRIFQSVQRWCAIEKPGRYTLYCFYREPIVKDDALYKPPSLLQPGGGSATPFFPTEVRDWIAETKTVKFQALWDSLSPRELEKEFVGWDARWRSLEGVESAHDIARFDITIRAGSPAEEEAMVLAWLRRMEEERTLEFVERQRNQAEATLESIYFSRQESWLPTMETWCGGGRVEFRNAMYAGLLLNPQIDATRIALNCSDRVLAYWEHWPQPGLLERLAAIRDDESDQELSASAGTWHQRVSQKRMKGKSGES